MKELEMVSQAGAAYLVLRLDETDETDELAVGMLRNNEIPGLLPMAKRWEYGGQALYYTISSLTPLSQGYAALGSEKRLERFLRDYCAVLQSCEEYLLEPSKLFLHEDYVYVKSTTGELSIPYVAVMGFHLPETVDLSSFFLSLVHKVASYLPPESRILPILYKQSFQGTFDPDALLRSLTELEPESRQRPRQPSASSAPVGGAPLPVPEKVKPKPPIPAAPVASPGSPAVTPFPVPNGTPPAPQPPQRSGGFLGLFGGGKSRKPKKEKDSAGGLLGIGKPRDTPSPVGLGFESPFPVPGGATPAGGGGKDQFPFQSPKNEAAGSGQSVPQAPFPPPVAPPSPSSFKSGGGGYTINWSGGDSGVPGGTIRMPEGVGEIGAGKEQTPVLWLVHRGDGHREQVTQSNFHVGRKQGGNEFVDYAVMNATGYMGADHAYFLLKDNKFYIVDNNSQNGTWQNEHRLQPSLPYELNNGDVIKMADEVFELDLR